MRFDLLGDQGITLHLDGELSPQSVARAAAIAAHLARSAPPGVIDAYAAHNSVTVVYDAARCPIERGAPHEWLPRWMAEQIAAMPAEAPPAARTIEIPVRYGGEEGPDLAAVAEHAGLTTAAVVELHANAAYFVSAVGFLPGFAYLAGLPAVLHTPRRESPRTHVPAGAVGIGGEHTGVYPVQSPGGWNLIGRTTLSMFDPTASRPALLSVGDRVRFVPVDATGGGGWS